MSEKRPPLNFEYIKSAAEGHWTSRVFGAVGIDFVRAPHLHQPCPMCGGRDRFRCDDKNGSGSWICNNCGAGKGIDLVMKFTGQNVRDAFEAVAGALGIDGKKPISPEEKQRWRAEQLARQEAEKRAQHARWKSVADDAFNRYIAATDISGQTHPYLTKKGIDAIIATGKAGIKLDKRGDLLIPLHYHNPSTGAVTLVNIQSIDQNGKKLFMTGGLVKGAYCTLGSPKNCDTLLICEGYATGASLFLATGGSYAVIVAFNAKNMQRVAPILRAHHPQHRLLFCADDDRATATKTGKNTGQSAATTAAQMAQGAWIAPDFKGDARADAGELTDFNDLHADFGLAEVTAQLTAALASYQPIVPDSAPEAAPAPQSSAADSVPVPQENAKDTPKLTPSDEEKLKSVLKDYAKIINNGKMSNNVFDTNQKIEYTKTQFAHKVGKKVAESFFIHDAKVLERTDVDCERRDKADQSIAPMLDRYALIFGTKEVWDSHLKTRFQADAIRMAHPNEFDVWLKSPSRITISPENIWFDPSGERRPEGNPDAKRDKDFINSFHGLPINGLDMPNAHELAEPIMNLLRHLCENNESFFVWVMRWLAIPIQKLGTKMDTALIFHGAEQGAGKSMFFDKVMSEIYGQYAVTLGQGQLESQYNDWVADKMYAVFEEIFSGKDRYAHMGFVKQLITSDKIYISKKYVSGWTQDNYVNCVFLSNDMMPLSLEQNDRRMVVLNPSAKIPEPIKQAVSAALADKEKVVIRAFLHVLMTYDLGGQNEHSEAIMTPAKSRLISVSMPSWERFFNEWRTDALPIAFATCLSHELFSFYTKWCQRSGERSCSETKLLTYIGTQSGITKQRVWYRFQSNELRRKAMCVIIGEVGKVNDSQDLWFGAQFRNFYNKVQSSGWYD